MLSKYERGQNFPFPFFLSLLGIKLHLIVVSCDCSGEYNHGKVEGTQKGMSLKQQEKQGIL